MSCPRSIWSKSQIVFFEPGGNPLPPELKNRLLDLVFKCVGFSFNSLGDGRLRGQWAVFDSTTNQAHVVTWVRLTKGGGGPKLVG